MSNVAIISKWMHQYYADAIWGHWFDQVSNGFAAF